jgi:hypothetical protein
MKPIQNFMNILTGIVVTSIQRVPAVNRLG